MILGVVKSRVLETHIDSLEHPTSYGHTKVFGRMRSYFFLKQGNSDILGMCLVCKVCVHECLQMCVYQEGVII